VVKRSLPLVQSEKVIVPNGSGGARLTAEKLFRALFEPLYPRGTDLGVLRKTDANPGKNSAIFAALHETAEVFAKLAPRALGARPEELELDGSDASVHRLASRIDLGARERLLAETAPSPGGGPAELPLFAHFVIHGTIYVGACIVKNHGAEWLVRSPLWETLVRLESRAGIAEISPFAWWLKSFSDDEIGKSTLLDRYRTHVEVPTFDPTSLPVIAPADRRIPRLEKVRYDLFYKLLKAHLPELKTVGDHFPSPARFEELGFRWLELKLVGQGRVLVVHGPTSHGVTAFFLSKEGFMKQHYYERADLTGHRLELAGDVVRFVLEGPSGDEIHETLFWGG
jgi:hypothetical protein